jgi:hypothetical protein
VRDRSKLGQNVLGPEGTTAIYFGFISLAERILEVVDGRRIVVDGWVSEQPTLDSDEMAQLILDGPARTIGICAPLLTVE